MVLLHISVLTSAGLLSFARHDKEIRERSQVYKTCA